MASFISSARWPRTLGVMKLPASRRGPVSLVLGAIAVATAATATYARSVHIPASGVVLNWLSRIGLVQERATAVPSVSDPGIFAVNDENALTLLTSVAVFFAAAAIVAALIAEWRREPTLYLSGGYVCGSMALAFFSLLVSLVSIVACIAVVLVLRQQRQDHDT